MPPDIFCMIMAASYVGRRDLQLTPARLSHVKNFQACYLKLVAALGEPFADVLKTVQERSAVVNHRHRMTGDAITFIIEEVIAMKGKIRVNELQEALDAFIDSQVLIPGKWQPIPPEELTSNSLKSRLLLKIQENLLRGGSARATQLLVPPRCSKANFCMKRARNSAARAAV